MLDPGRGSTKTGYIWAIARNQKGWGGADPTAVLFTYAPGRGHEHALALLDGFKGIVQCDGYGAYKTLAKRRPNEVVLAHCWSHVRRDFIDLSKEGLTPIAAEALRRIAQFYAIESEIRGRPPDERRSVRQARTKPLVQDMRAWLDERLGEMPALRLRGTLMPDTLEELLWAHIVTASDVGCLDAPCKTLCDDPALLRSGLATASLISPRGSQTAKCRH